MTDERDPGPVLLVVSWHFPSMRVMPRAFWAVRGLDRSSRRTPLLLWMHRWISRRSVALTSSWADRPAAEAWLRSHAFRRADSTFRALGGARRVESAAAPVPLEDQLR